MRSTSTDTCRSIAMAVCSLGRTLWRIRAGSIAGGIRTLPTSPPMSTSTSPARRSLWPAANRAAMEPPTETPTTTGGVAQVRSMSSPSQASAVAAPGGPRGAEARQVRRDDMVGRDQLGDDRQPDARPAALTVQQHEGRAVPALQHGGGHPGQEQPSFGDRGAGQQPLPEAVARGTATAALDNPLPAHG